MLAVPRAPQQRNLLGGDRGRSRGSFAVLRIV
jgi:hypothetical protein